MLSKLKIVAILLLLSLLSLCRPPVASAETISLHVSGNSVLTASNRHYVPYGISVYGGLEASDYKENVANDNAQIKAAALYWHANTIRFQVAESNLFANKGLGREYNKKFLDQLNKEVGYARSFHMAVVINDQTEFTSNTPNPTVETAKFWKIIASKYKDQPDVIFDVFNEPRLSTTHPNYAQDRRKQLHFIFTQNGRPEHRAVDRLTSKQIWTIWQHGGNINGVKYLGMQTLVDQIRLVGAKNLIWVEGAYGARRLPPNNKYLLQGSDIVYDIHHPNLNSRKSWNRIASLSAIRPVVDGEWAQYQSDWAECYSKAFTNVPLYLSFLKSHNIGVIAWSLQADSLVAGDGRVQPSNLNTDDDPVLASDLKKPSNLMPNYSCTSIRHGQGVGNLIQKDFSKNSVAL